MRITNNMLINNMVNYIGNNLTRMDKYQNQLATGKKISVPSDDPVVAARALKLRTDVAEVEQYKRNADDAQSWLEITETTLSNVGDVLQRVRELTVQAANGSNTADDTSKIAEEVKQLRTQLIHVGNTTYAGRYIFSGYKTDMPLMDETTGKFQINVNNNQNIKYEIGIGDSIDINVLGGDLFNLGRNAVGVSSGVIGDAGVTNLTINLGINDSLNLTVDGEAVFVTIPDGTYTNVEQLAAAIQSVINDATTTAADVSVTSENGQLQIISGDVTGAGSVAITGGTAITDLHLDALPNNNVTGAGQTCKLVQDLDLILSYMSIGSGEDLSNMLSNIDADMNNLLRVRADVGARMNRVELSANRLDSDNINFTKLMSQNEDVDMAETIMNLQNEENVYKASLAGGAKIIMPTLVDFLT